MCGVLVELSPLKNGGGGGGVIRVRGMNRPKVTFASREQRLTQITHSPTRATQSRTENIHSNIITENN